MVPADRGKLLNVVLFSGGRGSARLVPLLAEDSRIRLTVAINGYDDGASTGEVRRALGDCLGPSDFRKNASRVSLAARTCDVATIALLDTRLPAGLTRATAATTLRDLLGAHPDLHRRAEAFLGDLDRTGAAFAFDDASVGNLVFAGAFLLAGRRFNDAVDDYSALVGLPPGVIDNVTDGTNAFLAAVTEEGAILASEAAIVDARQHNRVASLHLIDRPLTTREIDALTGRAPDDIRATLDARRPTIAPNTRLLARLGAADLIIYGPGTQHSSLFPSYMTPGLARTIAANVAAIKLLITNIHEDAETHDASAVELIQRALHYFDAAASTHFPAPCLVTHCLINAPDASASVASYVVPGAIDAIEDPRLVRIGNYEDGTTGRHDARRVVKPFVGALLTRRERRRVAIRLYDADCATQQVQSLLEMVRGGIAGVSAEIVAFHTGAPLDARFARSLPFDVRTLAASGEDDAHFRRFVRDEWFDYVVLFESSGMYGGEDVVELVRHLESGRLDAVWGSRRLSVRDIESSYRVRYRHNVVLGTLSYIGSHVLSLACLARYGRYVSDTLSGVRAVRTNDALALDVPLTDARANERLLAALLARKADILEIPVRFVPLSPARARRPTIADGLRALDALTGLPGLRPARGRRTRPGAAHDREPDAFRAR